MTAPYHTATYSLYVAVCSNNAVADIFSRGAFDLSLQPCVCNKSFFEKTCCNGPRNKEIIIHNKARHAVMDLVIKK